MLDLSIVGTSQLLTAQIAVSHDAANATEGRYAWRVKASQLDGDCLARMWYAFRWALKPPISAKSNRIFDIGNAAETRFVKGYEYAGWTVFPIDPMKAGKKFPQWNAVDLHGHMSMYADAKASHPEFTGGELILHEYKTMNTRDFGTVESKQSVRAVKPEYYGQSVIYLYEFNLPWSLMTIENKNNQELYREIIMRDDAYAQRLLGYGETIATSKVRPARVAENPTYFKCKLCDFKDICHYGAAPDRNCRSCVNCTAIDGGSFYCDKWQKRIPNEAAILAGCGQYEAIA